MRFIIILFSLVAFLLSGCSHAPAPSPFTVAEEHPNTVAVLLPLTGPLAPDANAIRNGFLAAYYYSLKQGQSTTSINFIDSNQGNIVDNYMQAIANGARFVVGPLIKKNVAKLLDQADIKVPTLALNTVDNFTSNYAKNFYQFGLFTPDEVNQLANHAWQQNPGNALIIAPDNSWGKLQATILAKHWQASGGKILDTIKYQNRNQFTRKIKQTLQINTSYKDAREIKRIIGKNFKFVPQIRQDISAILLVSLPNQAREIVPILKFYYAGKIPVYATSSIYSGIENPGLNSDLNGVSFADMPWVLKNNNDLPPTLAALKAEISKNWPMSFHYHTKLYALGVDAYYLTLNLNKLLQNPNSGIEGATGIFYLDQYQHIYRKLLWTKIENGRTKLTNFD
ncbi:MAG: penicillin-binding protein activator [Gammaproteobacteria bacterium]|nr:penicillin-binding protein activator [Gammaproteobacteria bacterium]